MSDEPPPLHCERCGAKVVVVGRRKVVFEVVDQPLDGGPTRLEHTDERCRFHQFLRPTPSEHPLHRRPPTPRPYQTTIVPTSGPFIDKSAIRPVQRWRRVDDGA